MLPVCDRSFKHPNANADANANARANANAKCQKANYANANAKSWNPKNPWNSSFLVFGLWPLLGPRQSPRFPNSPNYAMSADYKAVSKSAT